MTCILPPIKMYIIKKYHPVKGATSEVVLSDITNPFDCVIALHKAQPLCNLAMLELVTCKFIPNCLVTK